MSGVRNLDVALRCRIDGKEKIFFKDDKDRIYELVVTMPNTDKMVKYKRISMEEFKAILEKCSEIYYNVSVFS